MPDMPHVGEGYNVHVTGLTHDERGYPNMTPPVQDRLVRRLQDKILEERRQDHAVRRRRASTAPTWWSSPTESLRE